MCSTPDMRGAQVTMTWNGCTLLGDVTGSRLEGDRRLLTVRHFNGEMWPVEPDLADCTVLERSYSLNTSE